MFRMIAFTMSVALLTVVPAGTSARQATAAELYVCSMHPNAVEAKPGQCSVCGMTLKARALKPMEKEIVDFFQANAAMMTLIMIGGLCYSVGAVVYGMKKPNPGPGVFGFHEIFHSLTVVAFLCHWIAILIIATHPLYP